MSSGRVQRRTVVAYLQAARFQLEKAIASGGRCREISGDQLVGIRLRWREVDEMIERLRPRRPSKRNTRPRKRK